jgi:hypothetical protein
MDLRGARSLYPDEVFCPTCEKTLRALVKGKTKEDFKEGCELSKDSAIFALICAEQKGFPCDGCNCKFDCALWGRVKEQAKTLLRAEASKEQFKGVKEGITNAQVAQALGISKRKASKLRSEGKVDLDEVRRKLNDANV